MCAWMDVESSLELCPGAAQVLDQTMSGTEFEPDQDLPAVLGDKAGFCFPRLVGLTPSIQVNFFIKIFLANIPCAQGKVCPSRRGFFLQRAGHASSCGQEVTASGTCENRGLFIKIMYLYLLLQSLCSGAFLKFSWIENAHFKTKTKTLTDVPWQKKRVQTQQGIQKGQTVVYGHGKGISNKCLWLGAGVFMLPVMSLWFWGLAYSFLFS